MWHHHCCVSGWVALVSNTLTFYKSIALRRQAAQKQTRGHRRSSQIPFLSHKSQRGFDLWFYVSTLKSFVGMRANERTEWPNWEDRNLKAEAESRGWRKDELYEPWNIEISFIKSNVKDQRWSRIWSSLRGLCFIDHYACSPHSLRLQKHPSPFLYFNPHLFLPQAHIKLSISNTAFSTRPLHHYWHHLTAPAKTFGKTRLHHTTVSVKQSLSTPLVSISNTGWNGSS